MFDKILYALILGCSYLTGADCEIEMPIDIQIAPVQDRGLASYYGTDNPSERGMYGSITATGEPFDPSLVACAHRTAPLDSWAIVTMAETGKWIVCRLNDRGPYGATLYEGGWGAMLPKDGGWKVVHREGNEWVGTTYHDERPGYYRGIMDLTVGAADVLDFDFHRGLNEVEVRYFSDGSFPIQFTIGRSNG